MIYDIENNIIKEIGEDVYTLEDGYGLFEYGISLLENRVSHYAYLCLFFGKDHINEPVEQHL